MTYRFLKNFMFCKTGRGKYSKTVEIISTIKTEHVVKRSQDTEYG